MKRSIACWLVVSILMIGCQGSPIPSPSPAPLRPSTSRIPSATPERSSSAFETPHWEFAGTPGLPGTAAVPQSDGSAVVIGFGPSGVAAEFWNASTNDWQAGPGLDSARDGFVVAPLHDGRALVTGGTDEAFQSVPTTFIFDPVISKWDQSGDLGIARTGASATVLNDGRVLLVGGYVSKGPRPTVRPDTEPNEPLALAEALTTAEVFDPPSGTWTTTGSMAFARHEPAAALLADGRVIVFGSLDASTGVGIDRRALSSAEIYDPATGQFALLPNVPPVDRSAIAARAGVDANLIPATDPDSTAGGSIIALSNGDAILTGVTQGWEAGDISRSFRLDATTSAWSEIGEARVSLMLDTSGNAIEVADEPDLAFSAGAVLTDGRVLVIGGSAEAQTRIFDSAFESSSPAPSMPESRSGAAIIALADGTALVLGGSMTTSNPRALRFLP